MSRSLTVQHPTLKAAKRRAFVHQKLRRMICRDDGFQACRPPINPKPPFFALVRGCSQLSQPDDGASEMNERQEGLGEFVVARGDASELLDATEETLDQIAALAEMPIE